jgi:hypothetical protein
MTDPAYNNRADDYVTYSVMFFILGVLPAIAARNAAVRREMKKANPDNSQPVPSARRQPRSSFPAKRWSTVSCVRVYASPRAYRTGKLGAKSISLTKWIGPRHPECGRFSCWHYESETVRAKLAI